MNRIVLLFVILLITFSSLFAQSDKYSSDVLRRHAVYLNVGFLSLDANYEHKLMTYEKGFLFGRVGFGYWADWAILRSDMKFHLSYISGKKKSHLELDVGLMFKGEFNRSSLFDAGGFYKSNLIPILNIGYRFQIPGRPFVFRVGIGTESFFYFSFGRAII